MSTPTADYIINIYPMLGRGLLWKTSPEDYRHKTEGTDGQYQTKVVVYKAKEAPRVHRNFLLTYGTWFSCDDQIKTALSAKRSEDRFSWIVAARDWHARARTHALQL